MSDTGIPVVAVVGWSGIGKTTFLERLLCELGTRGVLVGTIKHSAHPGSFDLPGSDSWRHAQAGSRVVVLVGPEQIATFERVAEGVGLDQAVARIRDVDLILVEGYKRARVPKIEVTRREHSDSAQLCSETTDLIALVTDQAWPLDVPQFALSDAVGVADLLTAHFELARR